MTQLTKQELIDLPIGAKVAEVHSGYEWNFTLVDKVTNKKGFIKLIVNGLYKNGGKSSITINNSFKEDGTRTIYSSGYKSILTYKLINND